MNAKTLKYIILILIGIIFLPALYDIFSGYGVALDAFGNDRGLQRSYPAVVFVTHTLTILIVFILLFTPGQQNVSPLHYFAQQLADKVYLYMNYTDKSVDKKGFEEKNSILSSLLIDLVFITAMTIAYFYILKKVNQPQVSYLYMIFYLFFIYIIISVNSYFTTLIERSEQLLQGHGEGPGSGDGVTYLQKKNIYTLALIIITIFLLRGGEVISKSWSSTIAQKDIPIVRWFTTDIQNTVAPTK